MSSASAPRTSSHSPEPSDAFEVEVHVLACGHGDTILVRFPGDKWALIDCFLPNNRTRAQFFQFIQSNDIDRLKWIFQTHPDMDHFFGMTYVLDHFTQAGRSMGYWCDGGLYAQDIQSLIWPDQISKKHYAKLQERLDELDDQGQIQFVELNDCVEPTSAEGYEDRVDLFPIGPSARTKRRVAREDLKKLAKNPNARLEANALSIILALAISDADENWNVLLPGDAGPEELKGAQEAWHRRAQERGKTSLFDAVKVPHHGSMASHTRELCLAKRDDRENRFAVISAGARPKLPDREVIRNYLSEGWTVMLTTRRHAQTASHLPMGLADRGRVSSFGVKTHNITISWTPAKGLSAAPPEAIVPLEELPLYETAVQTSKK